MGVRCLLGRRGSGKTGRCLELVRKGLDSGTPLFFLVPEQDTVQTEMFLAEKMHLQVFWNLEVLSLTRLARRILENTCGIREMLSDAGRAMALKGALLGMQGSLRYFRGSAGTAERMGDLMAEMRRGEVDAIQLRLAADRLPADSALAQKLYDLAAVYEKYDERISGKYQDGEDALRRSAQFCPDCAFLREACVIADGFDVLPRTALRLLAALGAVCREVTVTFELCPEDAPDASLYEPVRQSLFTLREMCAQSGTPCSEEVLADRPLPNPETEHLLRNLFSRRPRARRGRPESLHLVYAKDPYMESERAAGYLFEKIRTEGLRCRDAAILCPNLEIYGQRLELALRRRGLRAYVDRRASAAEHPAARYLLSAMTGAARYFRLEDMLRALKSGYAGVSAREADRLELYAMEHGLEGRLWEKPIEEEDVYQGNESENPLRSLEEIRQAFLTPLLAFRRGGQRRTVRDFCLAVVELLREDDLVGQLAARHRRLTLEGDTAGQQELRQIQHALLSVLDQAVELCGEESMGMRDFIRLTESGLQATSLGSIPMDQDSVYIGEVTRFKGRNTALVMVLGVNADAIPSRQQEDGLLSEEEKLQLMAASEQSGARIRLNLLSQRAAIERFALAGVLASPAKELVLSFSSMDLRGAALHRSPLLNTLQGRVFPDLPIECGVTGDRYVYAGSLRSVRELLSGYLTGRESGAERREEPEGLLAALRRACPEEVDALEAAGKRRREAEHLDEAAARALYLRRDKMERYGVEGLVVSISQLETFALCPFAHFIDYGIRPRELREPEMDARDRGTLEHRAVERFASRLYRMEPPVTQEQAEALMEEILRPLLEEDGKKYPQEGLTLAGHRQIRRTMGRMSRILAMHRNLSDFRAWGEEISFTPDQILPLETEKGEKVYLEGKIDRVDLMEMEGERYARVIDYKSGSTDLRLEDVYYGLRLQLFLYLDAVLTMRSAHPAGVFYQKLSQGALRLDGRPADEKFEQKQNKKLSLNGYVLDDERVVESMCRDPERTEELLPLSLRHKGGKALPGEFSEKSREKMLSEEEFSLLRRHTRRKLTELAGEMLEGDAQVSPMQTTGTEECRYCPYAAVCGYEHGAPGGRKGEKLSAEEVMKRIREEDEHA